MKTQFKKQTNKTLRISLVLNIVINILDDVSMKLNKIYINKV